jgi:DNA-binding transcriptional MerR regulator
MAYGGSTASAVAGISYRHLDYWARTGLVAPSIDGGLYSFRDVVALKVVKRLLDAGVSLQNVRRAVATLRKRGEHDLASVTLVSDGTTVYECRSSDEILDLLKGGQAVFAIALSGAFKETEGSLADAVPIDARHIVEESVRHEVVDELALARARRRRPAV